MIVQGNVQIMKQFSNLMQHRRISLLFHGISVISSVAFLGHLRCHVLRDDILMEEYILNKNLSNGRISLSRTCVIGGHALQEEYLLSEDMYKMKTYLIGGYFSG